MENPRRDFINTYLDSPILESEMLKCYRNYLTLVGGERVDRPSKTALYLSKRYDSSWEVECYTPHLLPLIGYALPESGMSTGTSEAWRIAHTVWKYASEGLSTINAAFRTPPVRTDLPSRMRALLAKAEVFMRFVETLASIRVLGSHATAVEESDEVIIVGDQYSCALIYTDDRALYILPYEAVLMLKDMFLARANVYLGIHLIYDNDPSLLRAVNAAIRWEEECLYRYGNRGYEILSKIEPLTKAYVIHAADPLLGNHEDDVLARIRNVVIAKERELGAREDYQADVLIAALEATPAITHVVEIFGLQRMTGHPLIDPRVGGLSAAQEASKPTPTLYSSARRLRNNWCRLYLEGFVHRLREWPPLRFTNEGKMTQLYQLNKLRDLNIRRDSYPLSDWDHVRFRPHQDFDYYTNFTDLMDDRSISYYRDEFRATWDRSVKPRSHKRLLLEMLSREEISIRAIIEQVEARVIPAHWFIVSLYPKEREFKLAARMFSMMPFEMRAFFACLEANIADHIFPNLPQQTMTLSKTTTMERFFNLSLPLTTPGRERLFIEVDLSRWNLRWRDLPMRLIGMDLDDIFGTDGRYTFVHEFFRECMIIVRVAGYPPEGYEMDPPPTSPLIWYNHEGGFEGIVQKDWTIATYAMVDLGMEEFDIEYSLLGQGDNQVILSTVSVPPVADPPSYLRDLASRIKKKIAEACASVGQEAKEEECLESTNVITYSKDFYVGGGEYFLSLKAVSRIFPRGASDFPTVSNGIAALTSACVAAAERLKQPLLGYFLFLFHAARFLIRIRSRPTVEGAFAVKPIRRKLTESMITSILGLPGSLGGLPVASLCSFIYKGGGDPCSKDLASIKILASGGMTVLSHVNTALSSKAWLPADINPAQLLEDPYAIPLRRAGTAENRVLSHSLRSMRKRTENRAIRELVDESVDQYDKDLCASLLAVTPFNPTLLSDVRSFSIVGAREMVTRMFTLTRTVQGLMYSADEDPGASILSASTGELKTVLGKFESLPATRTAFGPVYDGMTAMRKNWQTEEWKVPVVGVTSYMPLDWRITVDEAAPDSAGVLLSYSPSEDPWHMRGKEDPYLGTDTAEKRTKHGYRIITSSAAEKAYARLAIIATQPGVDETFVELVHRVAATRSSISLHALLPYLSQAVGGSIAHRYQSTLGNRGASVLGCGTLASHICINSDYAGVLSASLLDYPVMFQELFCAAIGLMNLVVPADPTRPHYIRIITPDHIEALPEDTVKAKLAPGTTPILPTNPIAYCTDLSLLRIARPMETLLASPLATRDLVDISSGRIAYQAAYRQLMNRHTAHLIADLGYGAVRLPMDLLEYRGLGLSNVVVGVSAAIARFVIDAMFSRSHLDLRWNPMPVIAGLSASFGSHLVNAARHPLFSDDPFVQEYLYTTAMKYNRRNELDTATGVITSSVLANLDKLTSLHTDLTELVFDDDQEEIPLLRAESIMKRIALRAVVRGELTAEDGYLLARRNLVQAVRMAETAGGKIRGIYHLACTIAEWALREGKPGLAEEAGSLAEGDLIKRVYRSQVQVLRTMRGRLHTERAVARHQSTMGSAAFVRPPIDDAQPVNTIPDVDLAQRRADPSYIRFSLARRHIRKYGKHSPAVYSYWSVRSLCSAQNVVILGSGNGGALTVAVEAGAASVVKHDLARDLEIQEVASLSRSRGGTIISRSKASIGKAGGDLESDDTWSLLAPDLSGYRVIILDVPTTWAAMQHILSRLSSLSPGSLLITRWIGSDHDISYTIPTAAGVQGYCGIIPVFSGAGYHEVLIAHRIEWSGAWRACHGIVSFGSWCLPDYEGISATGGGLEWNNITYRGVSPDVFSKAEALDIQAVGRERRTFTHSQWTKTLWFLLSLDLDKTARWKEAISRLLVGEDHATVRLGSTDIPVVLTPQLRRWLEASYPRTRR